MVSSNGIELLPAEQDVSQRRLPLGPGVVVGSHGNSLVTCPISRLAVQVRCTGPVAAVQVVQAFQNSIPETMELTYLFPLPNGAAVSRFRAQVGQRLIEALFVVFYRYMKRDPGRHRSIHYIFLFFPLLGPLYKTLVVTRVLQSLATMLDVGVPLLAAFRACETLTTNQYIIYLIASVRKLVVEGETMTSALQKNPLFPPAVVQLVAAGEETSDLIAMFKFSAKILEEDTDIVIDKMSVNLEPIIMAIMGVVVGFIVIAAMLPITQLLQNL